MRGALQSLWGDLQIINLGDAGSVYQFVHGISGAML
jgi:hypothetical protein